MHNYVSHKYIIELVISFLLELGQSNMPPKLLLLCALIFLIAIFVSAQPQDDAWYYDRCRPFTCGVINFSFPFSDSATFGTAGLNCGLSRFQVSCNPSHRPVLYLSGTTYEVRDLYPNSEERAVTVVNAQLVKDLTAGSCESLRNLTVPSSGVKIDDLSLPPSVALQPHLLRVRPQSRAPPRPRQRDGGELELRRLEALSVDEPIEQSVDRFK